MRVTSASNQAISAPASSSRNGTWKKTAWNEVLSVSSVDAVEAMRQLARQHGLFCGPSSGAHLIAARRIREMFPELKNVVTIFCDKGEKYLQDYFMPAAQVTVGSQQFA